MPVGFRPLMGSFGAEVIGVPPTLEMEDTTFREVEAAWYRHSILLFRGLKVSPEQQVAFTQRFGPLHYMLPPNIVLDGYPEIFVVSNETKDGKPFGLKRAGEGFHSDGEDKLIPNAGSLLYAIKIPPERGDTLFVDMYGVYETLPDDIKHKLRGKRALRTSKTATVLPMTLTVVRPMSMKTSMPAMIAIASIGRPIATMTVVAAISPPPPTLPIPLVVINPATTIESMAGKSSWMPCASTTKATASET